MDIDLSKHLEEYNEITGFLCKLITGLVDKDYINTVLVSGPPGIGKSYNIDYLLSERQEREENPIRYIKYNGHVTPKAFFDKLKDNQSSDCVVLFDDADSVITDEDCVNILKAASERTKRRHISWVTSSSRQEGFDFEGKIVIATNIVVSQSPHLDAIKDRFHLFNMDVTYEQKLAKIEEIAKSSSDPDQLKVNKEILRYLHERKDIINSDKITIRTFKKLQEVAMLMPEDWKRFVEVSGTYLDRPKIAKLKKR